MKILNILQNILSLGEFELLQNSKSVLSDEVLLNHLIGERVVLSVDWSGEDGKYHISKFLQTRAFALSEKMLNLDEDDAYKAFEKQLDIQHGDAVPFLLKYFEKILKKQGFTISLIDMQDDSYYVALSTIEQAKKLRKSNSFPWRFISLNVRKTKVLYTIDCPDCGDMNVWEIPIKDTPPENGRCSSCGKLLWDNKGNALAPYEKEYC